MLITSTVTQTLAMLTKMLDIRKIWFVKRMLELNKGGFADSVEIKKAKNEKADLFYFRMETTCKALLS